jgi:hypothetical protein
MWKHYRKTLLPVQAFILVVTAFLYFVLRVDPRNLLIVFIVMQLGSLYGARVIGRLRRKLDDADALPLAKRRA